MFYKKLVNEDKMERHFYKTFHNHAECWHRTKKINSKKLRQKLKLQTLKEIANCI